METSVLKWRGEEIGTHMVTDMDMWYLDGKFVSNNTELAQEFEKLVSTFNFKEVFSDWTKGTMVEMGVTTCVVLGMKDGVLSSRMLTSNVVIEKLKKEIVN